MNSAGETPKGARRRDFVKAAGLASTAAAAVPLLGALTATEAQAMRATREQRAARYQETDHVKKYYELNRR